MPSGRTSLRYQPPPMVIAKLDVPTPAPTATKASFDAELNAKLEYCSLLHGRVLFAHYSAPSGDGLCLRARRIGCVEDRDVTCGPPGAVTVQDGVGCVESVDLSECVSQG